MSSAVCFSFSSQMPRAGILEMLLASLSEGKTKGLLAPTGIKHVRTLWLNQLLVRMETSVGLLMADITGSDGFIFKVRTAR